MRLHNNVLQQHNFTCSKEIDSALQASISSFSKKFVILDDDPTGVQTIHDLSVYTDWSVDSLKRGLSEATPGFFVLTNSRALTEKETIALHEELTRNLIHASKELDIPFQLISRSDSTLRGHYPLEDEIIKGVLEEAVDGEILCPFFLQGNRYTIDDIHYVKQGDTLISANESEFAKDATFGYHSLTMQEYVEEKTKRRYRKEDVISVSLEELESENITSIQKKLESAVDFQKIIINATNEKHLKVACLAIYKAMEHGKTYLFRTAASFVKVMLGVSSIPLLEKKDLLSEGNGGGLIVVGSHTSKTTAQLNSIRSLDSIVFLECDVAKLLTEEKKAEMNHVIKEINTLLSTGKTACVYTSRAVLTAGTPEESLKLSVSVSEALCSIVRGLQTAPRWMVAKGGITSSDLAVKALGIHHALVKGQIEPGIPVYITEEDALFSSIPYIIFPGNVGEEDTLYKVVQKLL